MQADPNSTVRDVIITVLQSQEAPRSTKSILKQVLEKKLYDFDTDHPETILNKALRRHCLDVLHDDAREEKHFKEGPKSHYTLLPETVLQKLAKNGSKTKNTSADMPTSILEHNPYDAFQSDAVSHIVNDYSTEKNGRFLLCIPTGGGKTFTAVKSTSALIDAEIITEQKSKVLWVAHREELLKQAKETTEKHATKHGLHSFTERFIFASNNTCKDILKQQHKEIGFIVIDEAHHAAANTYQVMFEYSDIPILGLTATPSRHDNQPLPFSRESYSIGIPELIELGILIKPEIVSLPGGSYTFDSFDSGDLEVLNCQPRNQKILTCLQENHDKFNKVVIFAATKQHGKDLLKLINASTIASHYEHVAYIDGESNSDNLDRQDFIDNEKARDRSIIINVQILTEGYDDPKIDCVFIAAPTKSKLFYMQAAGRALRLNQAKPDKKAYIVEIVDELPNIKYRIDNRWLFAEISDWLEPEVVDYACNSTTELVELNKTIISNYGLDSLNLTDLPKNGADQIELLLFKYYVRKDQYKHVYLPLTTPERNAYIQFFNALSERLSTPKFRKQNSDEMMGALKHLFEGSLANYATRGMIHNAMHNVGDDNPTIQQANPWITYMTITDNIQDTPPSSDIQEVEVETKFLVLDPNNPRFLTQQEEKIPLEKCLDQDVVIKTHKQMTSADANAFNFRINELKASIVTNGYRPVDRIFVRSIPNTDHYLVIEGNRRVTAIREILESENPDHEPIKKQLQKIKVAVITADLTEAELKAKITTILGIRHHGSLKKWSPFAQARNIYKHYKELQGDDTEFEWDGESSGIGEQVADALSISAKEVKERLRVYRAMEQLEANLDFEPNAKMNQRYYSVISDVLNRKQKGLNDYLPFNDQEFKLSDEAITRFDQLCYFTKLNRKEADGTTAPINDPTQWRSLNQILQDEDLDKRDTNLKKITEEHRKPSEVWAERAEELNKLEWSKFFEKVELTLSSVDIGKLSLLNLDQTEKAKELVAIINETLSKLESNG
jgi:superfamily II DNA or RNA helicase